MMTFFSHLIGEHSRLIRDATCAAVLPLSLGACATASHPAQKEAIAQEAAGQVVPAQASDMNSAIAQLYRWWGLFEAPADTDLSPQLPDLFADNVQVKMTGIELDGADAVKAAITSRPVQGRIAHHVTDIQLTTIDHKNFRLDVRFIAQVEEDGVLRSTPGYYSHTMIKRPDGMLVFSEITAGLKTPIALPEYQSTYLENRAKVTIYRFQSIMDSLADPSPLKDLIKPAATFAGLIAADSKDQGATRSAVITGYDALAAWFAQGPDIYASVSHQELEFFNLTPLGDDRYQVIAQFEWVGRTHNGETSVRHNPRTWILHDAGGQHMKIEALLE